MFQTKSFKYLYNGTLLSYGSADFNRDGLKDFLFGGPVVPFSDKNTGFKIISFSASGELINQAGVVLNGSPNAVHARAMFIGDLNGDGLPDVFSGNHGYDAAPYPGEPNTLLLSDSQGALTNSPAKIPSTRSFTHSVAGADIDGDGDIDLLVGVLGNLGVDKLSPYLLMNDGSGNFIASDDRLPNKLTSANPADGFTAATFVDINNDGRPDLIIGGWQNSTSMGRTYLNSGDGYFTQQSEKSLPVGAFGSLNTIVTAVQSADVDRDGFNDLIVAQTDGNYRGTKISILINDRSGSFRDESTARIPGDHGQNWAQGIQYVDVNNDGHKDIILQSDQRYNNEQPILWLNNGFGQFSAAPASMTAGFGAGIVPIDFNRDGRMDYMSFHVMFRDGDNDYTIRTHLNTSDGEGPEWLWGSPDADAIDGRGGNDVIVAGKGNDLIDGGAGFDIAVFAGRSGRYSVREQDGGWIVSGPDGIDTLRSIERLQFDDIAVDLVSGRKINPVSIEQFRAPAEKMTMMMTGAPASEEQLGLRADFAELQYAYYAHVLRVANPSLGPYEALGVAFAKTSSFDAKFSATSSSSDFVRKAYGDVFGHGPTAAQEANLVGQVNYFTGLYESAGVEHLAAVRQASGAVFGQIVGYSSTPISEII